MHLVLIDIILDPNWFRTNRGKNRMLMSLISGVYHGCMGGNCISYNTYGSKVVIHFHGCFIVFRSEMIMVILHVIVFICLLLNRIMTMDMKKLNYQQEIKENVFKNLELCISREK